MVSIALYFFSRAEPQRRSERQIYVMLTPLTHTSYCPLVAEAFDMEFNSIQCAKETHSLTFLRRAARQV